MHNINNHNPRTIRTYQVAGHVFTLDMPSTQPQHSAMDAYKPFEISQKEDVPLFYITIHDNLHDVLGTHCWDYQENNCTLSCYKDNDDFWIRFKFPSMQSNHVTMYLPTNPLHVQLYVGTFAHLDTMIMLAYCHYTTPLKTVVIHASAVTYQGKAALFNGPSGSGKSTHSKLWLDTLSQAELLNDDHPVIRVDNQGNATAYGSPWSGKTACYKNKQADLIGIVRIIQHDENEINLLKPPRSISSVFYSCANARLDNQHACQVLDTAATISQHVSIYELRCRPDYQAAKLSIETLLTTT